MGDPVERLGQLERQRAGQVAEPGGAVLSGELSMLQDSAGRVAGVSSV
jgi:hypothetical protein